MRITTVSKIVLIVGVAAFAALAQKPNDQMQPKRNNTGIFANEIREAYEEPIGRVGTNDVLTVTEVKRNHLKVRTAGGVEGFVEKRELNRATRQTSTASRAMAFEAAEVIGYLDNPTPIYIIDMDGAESDPITLQRSFREALRENVDKETMERVSR